MVFVLLLFCLYLFLVAYANLFQEKQQQEQLSGFSLKIKTPEFCVRLNAQNLKLKDVFDSVGTNQQLCYKDEDGDVCRVATQQELDGALFYLSSITSSKTIVFSLASIPAPPPPPSSTLVSPLKLNVRVTKSKKEVLDRHQALSALIENGFVDMAKNIKALDVCGNDVPKAVEYLLKPPTRLSKINVKTVQYTPPDPSATDRHYALGCMVNQGYTDVRQNIDALKVCNNNAERAIELIQRQRSYPKEKGYSQIKNLVKTMPYQPAVTSRHLALGELVNQGFSDVRQNIDALAACNNNVPKAIELIQRQKGTTKKRVIKVKTVPYEPSDPSVTPRHFALGELVNAGFSDIQQNIDVLKICNNNVRAAVELILSQREREETEPHSNN